MLNDFNKTVVLELERPEGSFSAWLTFLSVNTVSDEDVTFLGGIHDRDQYTAINNPERKKEFLTGRKALMLSLGKMQPGFSREIEVARGVFGFPFLKGSSTEIPEISIAHSDGLAMALVFPAGQQMAIDCEAIRLDRPSRLQAIRSSLTIEEQDQSSDNDEMSALNLYLLWSQKEALAKVLKCGLTVPFPQLETINRKEYPDRVEVNFRNFFQYRAMSVIFRKTYVFTLVLPRKTNLVNIDILSEL